MILHEGNFGTGNIIIVFIIMFNALSGKQLKIFFNHCHQLFCTIHNIFIPVKIGVN